MPRRTDSGWGRDELANARELARMWDAGIVRAAKAQLAAMPPSLQAATVATMVVEMSKDEVPSFLRYLRSAVAKASS